MHYKRHCHRTSYQNNTEMYCTCVKLLMEGNTFYASHWGTGLVYFPQEMGFCITFLRACYIHRKATLKKSRLLYSKCMHKLKVNSWTATDEWKPKSSWDKDTGILKHNVRNIISEARSHWRQENSLVWSLSLSRKDGLRAEAGRLEHPRDVHCCPAAAPGAVYLLQGRGLTVWKIKRSILWCYSQVKEKAFWD